LDRLPGDTDALREETRALENHISLLDHRRFEAECRRADALRADARDVAALAAAEIEAAIAEHRACTARALAVRDAVLRRLDEAISRD
jgi:hypothetical protein